MSTNRRTRAWVEVRAAALRENLRTVRERVGPGAGLIPMVKADAYGLGMERAVRALEPVGPWGWGVATLEEGRSLRELDPRRPILVVSPLPRGCLAPAVEAGLTTALSDLDALDVLADAATGTPGGAAFHLEVDTGMGRAGFDWRSASDWAPAVRERVEETGGLRWEGCFTHFHSADLADDGAVQTQWDRFRDALAHVPDEGRGMVVHACNSAGALRRPDLAADAVRPGIFLYGASAGEGLPEPRPVVAVRARVVHVREASPGTPVGYGSTHVARGWEHWATLGIGYGDGLPRALSGRGHALLLGRRVPIVGRISMDVTVVDISDAGEVEPGEVATLVGEDGEARLSLDEVAEQAGTISYEVLTGLAPRLPRIWIEEGEG